MEASQYSFAVASPFAVESRRDVEQFLIALLDSAEHVRRGRGLIAEALRGDDVDDVQLLLLRRVAQAAPHGIAQIELAREIGVSPSQLSGLIESLVRREWLTAQASADDRRRRICRLTPLGEQRLGRMLESLHPFVADAPGRHVRPSWSAANREDAA